MSGIAAELELESELEQELQQEAHEMESSHEMEHEQEAEHEAFFNHLAAMADRGGRSQALRRIALAAARSALRARAKSYPVIEGEMESELEGVGELELEASPTQRGHFAPMMEHIGHAAAEAANEQEAAEHFLPLIGLAAKFVAPKLLSFAAKKLAPRILGRVAPQLTRGVANVARTLFRTPTTRPLLHAMPRIARGTMQTLVRRVARGRPITPNIAVRTLARQTVRTLSSPRALAQTYRRSLGMDRRYHRQARRLLGNPTGPIVRAADTPAFPGGQYWPGSYAPPYAFPTMSDGMIPTTAPGQPVCPTCGR